MIDLTSGQASVYSQYFDAVSTQIASLVSFLDQLEAKEEERVWLKRQSDGELDDSKMVEGLTGEASVYKRRGMEKRQSFLSRSFCPGPIYDSGDAY